jgi:CheY-like chemotaxis protein
VRRGVRIRRLDVPGADSAGGRFRAARRVPIQCQAVRVLALVEDLMFASRIREAARGSEAVVETQRSSAALVEACRRERPGLVLLDLDADRLRPLEAVRELRAEPGLAELPLVGFVSHVHAERAQAAQQAGCTRVLARGAFVQELPALLAGR